MIVSQLFDCFIIFSFVGWIYECIYCTCNHGHWQNRGFLYGPICPIYGSGVVLALIVFHLIPPVETNGEHPLWAIFLICAVGSAILEFVTSWVLEKCFHALWWDYSSVPFNIQGRICLPATCGFGIAGVVVVRLLIPFLDALPRDQHPYWNEIASIGFALVMGMDLALTVASLTRILERMESAENEFNSRMESGVQTIQQGPSAVYNAAKGATKSAGETAAIAAMLATDAARDQAENAAIAAMLATDAAKERAENAALAAMQATDTAKERAEYAGQEMSERVRAMMENFSMRERYHLRSIKVYRPVHKKGERPDTSERLRRLFSSLQDKAGEREVRRK